MLSDTCPSRTDTRKVIIMSTATANYISAPLPNAAPGRSVGGSPARGGHLRLVPIHGQPVEVATVGTLRGRAAHGASRPGAVRDAHLRLTRRGRLAVTSTVAIVLALVGLSLLSALGPASAMSSVVVEPGSSLSQIATEHLPGVPLGEAITDIQRANSLSTTSIAVGQELVIPGR